MAKKPTLTTLTSGYGSTTLLNSNFNDLNNAFNNTLSLDGSTPNAMEADLDMNSNDILNVSSLDVSTLRVSGTAISATSAISTTNTEYKYIFKDVVDLLSDTRELTTYYTVGDYVLAGGFRYEVVASGGDVTNAAGVPVEFDVLPSELGTYNVQAFGAKGDGTTDDTSAITLALAAGAHVVVPEGTYLISSTITVPSRKKLEFLGGWSNLTSSLPLARLVKGAAMTTTALVISSIAVVTGGGIECLAGNTGDGVQLAGNSAKLSDFFVSGAGRDGVRVGVDGTYANVNSTVVERIRSRENGRHGIYVHQGVGNPAVGNASDTNQGTLLHCMADGNVADGIKIGHAYWVSLINCLTQVNGGYGLHLSGALAVVNGSNYPECRRANVIGGDFNEGNVAGQVFDQSYFSLFTNADSNSFPTNAGNAYQGSGRRACFGAQATTFEGATLRTAAGNAVVKVDDGTGGGSRAAFTIKRSTTGSNGDGTSILSSISPDNITFVDASRIETAQLGGNQYSLNFKVWNAGAEETFLTLSANNQSAIFSKIVRPGSDNAISLGTGAFRWSTVYAGTGTINTSDEREKQQIKPIDDAAIRAWGNVEYCQFKFNDAVSEKGENARWHFGVIAQRVKDAFEAEGLDAFSYGILCYDEWEDDLENGVVSGSRFGVRYSEALALECAYLRSKLNLS